MQSDWLRQYIVEAKIEVATLAAIYKGFYVWLKKHWPYHAECLRLGHRRYGMFKARTRSALKYLRQNGEAALIGRAKYRFFI